MRSSSASRAVIQPVPPSSRATGQWCPRLRLIACPAPTDPTFADEAGGVQGCVSRGSASSYRVRPPSTVATTSPQPRRNEARPELGRTVAIGGSDLPAFANGQRYVSKGGRLRERYSDPDATWGHRSSVSSRSGGGYYGYKLHAAVCTTTGLPLAWQVETARDGCEEWG